MTNIRPNTRFALALIVASLWPLALHAQTTAWVSDQLPTTVNDKPARNGKFLGTVSAGETLEITGAEKDGYLPIRTDKLQGWVLAKNIMTTPSVHAQLADIQRELSNLQAQNKEIASRGDSLTAAIAEMNAKIRAAEADAENAKAELLELRRVSGNAIAISERNKALQSETVNLEQRIVAQTHEIHRLQQAANRQQWLVGGGLVIAGFILQWFFSLLRQRNKRRDQFMDL
ncbi:MAG: TIGR04211 family SH3 domain-containing protein [Cardiobacteriaceae bacterium]|nr:TIGR04211 family SH3 domain-containing protein [Cardiobacteriaceae bacterium]